MGVTTIRISEINKTRLNKYKKNNGSYENGICSMMDYFESTGIKPTDTLLNPSNIIKNSSERVVKILKNIENKKIDKMIQQNEFIIDKIENINSQKRTDLVDENTPDLDSYLSLEEGKVLNENLQRTYDENKRLNLEIVELNNKVFKLKSDKGKASISIDIQPVREAIKKALKDIKEETKPSFTNSSISTIKGHVLNEKLKTIDNLITNL